jgi:hypothetical protein
VKRKPPPSAGVALIVPSWAWTIDRAIASPSPLPPL